MEYELISLCCEAATDGGHIMEVLSQHSGKEIRSAGTCNCDVNKQRAIEHDAAHDSWIKSQEIQS